MNFVEFLAKPHFGVFARTIHIRSVLFWNNFLTVKELEYLAEFFCRYSPYVGLHVCRSISLDGNCLMWILSHGSWEKTQN